MDQAENKAKFRPGITWRSLCATLFCLLVMGMGIQYAEVIQAYGGAPAEQAVSIPAVVVLVLLLALLGAGTLVARRQLMTRQELLCVLYAMIIETPMMTQGMWHRFLGLIAATPREGNFQYIDAFNDKLWPHGPNLLEGALSHGRDGLAGVQGTVTWSKMEYETGKSATLPVLSNARAGDVSSVSFLIPVSGKGRSCLKPGESYLVSFLTRPANLSPDSYYFARLYEDENQTFSEVISERQPSEVTYLHQKGFLRVGKYGVEVPALVQRQVRLEVGLSGPGELAVFDPKFLSVAALDGAYRGRRIISEGDYGALPVAERAGLIVKPDHLFSLAGLKFLVSGYIPLADWGQTALAWSTPVFLLLLGLFAVGVVMRKQWAESERYSFPLARIPCALVGEPDEAGTSVWSAIWRNRLMWTGLIVGLAWGLLRMWAFYNPKFPNTAIEIPLSQYLDDPGWNGMWNVKLSVSAVVVSVCMFFELNVLLSFVVGFFAYRSLLWLGGVSGLTVYTGYPFRYDQAVGAYLGYAAVVLFLCRKYLRRVVTAALLRNREASGDEAVTYRTALLIIVGVHVGIAGWAYWLGVPMGSLLAFFFFLMLVGFVAIKARCECGLPSGYFTPYNGMIFVALLGGLRVFGAEGVLIALIASGFLTVSVFFLIPGAQFELLEYGRRHSVHPRHTLYAVVLGILGGLFVGGWVFLSNAYALGGESIRFQWAFNQEWFFGSYKALLAQATSEFVRAQGGAAPASGLQPATWGLIFGAVVTMALTILRQLFAGFWFHPIGFILGSSHMMEGVWGSVLAAWVIRATVLKFAGAATVKTKLFPFFVGVFLGSVIFLAISTAIAAHLQANGVERIFNVVP
jgi:hypothetical protein